MDFINCPFDDMNITNMPICIIFDTPTIIHAKEVAKIIEYLAKNYDNKETMIINSIIKANIGEHNFNLLKSKYIDSYNHDNNTIKRYIYLYDEKDVFSIIDAFNIIFKLIPLLSNIATYYIEKRKCST